MVVKPRIRHIKEGVTCTVASPDREEITGKQPNARVKEEGRSKFRKAKMERSAEGWR